MARFLETVDLLPHDRRLRVLELGANPYFLTILIRRIFDYKVTLSNFFNPNIFASKTGHGFQSVLSAEFDESLSFDYAVMNLECSEYPFPDASFDVILFCEILEHLVVDPIPVFSKLRRLLAPGGEIIVTTPNAVRLVNVAHMFHGTNYFDRYHPEIGVHGRHNREFTVEELNVLLTDAGFKVTQCFTKDRHDYNRIPIATDNYGVPGILPYTKSGLEHRLSQIGADLNNRGDNIYLRATRLPDDGQVAPNEPNDDIMILESSDRSLEGNAIPKPEKLRDDEATGKRVAELEAEVIRVRERLRLSQDYWSAVHQSRSWRVIRFFRSLIGRDW